MTVPARHLFEPTRINALRLENRLIRSATWEGMCSEEGRPTAGLIKIYRELAKGGSGLLITGFAYVTGDGKPLPGAMGLHNDAFGAEMQALTTAVHREGGKICAQLGHCGGQTRSVICGGQPIGPSAVHAPQYQAETPVEMTTDDIARVTNGFATAARRAQSYGFDAVQLHAAHGYLLNQFLSPHTNHRQDDYGGTLEGRSRFLLEVYRRVREAVGAEFPVLVKLNGSDNLDDGFCLEEACLVAKALDAAGVDAIEVTSGTPASGEFNPLRRGIDRPEREAYNLPLAKVIKQSVRCPVIIVGGIRSLWTAKAIIRRNDADYIALCRPLVHEPDLPLRWHWSEGNTLARCNSCNGCFKTALKGNLRCVTIGNEPICNQGGKA